jgi:hypothetical protein
MSNFDEFLSRFVRNYTGKKLCFVLAGGGVSAAKLALVPGSSKVLYDLSLLYDEDATVEYLERYDHFTKIEQMVSEDVATRLYAKSTRRLQDTYKIVAATSALTTNRARRGENQAFIVTSNQNAHLRLDKLPESVYSDPIIPWREQQIAVKRQKEDELVARVAIQLATDFEPETLEGMFANGTLRRL